MCFSIPYKVLEVKKEGVLIEGEKIVKLDKELKVKKGEYIRIRGNVIVDKLTKSEGLKIRNLIQSLNNYRV